MSEEKLKAFLEAIKADAGLQEQLKAAGDADAVVAIANAAGFEISPDNLRKEVQVELSEEDLEGLTGGFMYEFGGGQEDRPLTGGSSLNPSSCGS